MAVLGKQLLHVGQSRGGRGHALHVCCHIVVKVGPNLLQKGAIHPIQEQQHNIKGETEEIYQN